VTQLGADHHEGHIRTSISTRGDVIKIRVSDNGMGWPVPDKERLLEPYVTTRDSGTGLGLAIVMRIAADHGGHLTLHDRADGKQGAVIEIVLPEGNIDNENVQSSIFNTKDAGQQADENLS